MTPEQISSWADAAIRMQEMTDLYGPGLVLASCLYTGWRTCRWICRRTLQACDRIQERRELRRTPAAHDNQPPVDDDALATCRSIARQAIAHPHISRRVNNHLRQKGDETP